MDNLAYEEFPKTEDNESVDTSQPSSEQTENDDRPPPVYTPSAVYTPSTTTIPPRDLPPSYYPSGPLPPYPLQDMASIPPRSYYPPQFYPYGPPMTGSMDLSNHHSFGVLVEPPGGGLPPPSVYTDPPKDYLAPSIFNLLICCFIFGLIAIVKSINTRAAIQVGDYETAYRSSLEARNWNIAASVTGGIVWTLAIISCVVLIVI